MNSPQGPDFASFSPRAEARSLTLPSSSPIQGRDASAFESTAPPTAWATAAFALCSWSEAAPAWYQSAAGSCSAGSAIASPLSSAGASTSAAGATFSRSSRCWKARPQSEHSVPMPFGPSAFSSPKECGVAHQSQLHTCMMTCKSSPTAAAGAATTKGLRILTMILTGAIMYKEDLTSGANGVIPPWPPRCVLRSTQLYWILAVYPTVLDL